MAVSFSFRVLENNARNYTLQVNGIDAATTTAGTSNGTSTGIVAANGYSGVTTHFKVRRLMFATQNCTLQLQWHATTNVDLAYLAGTGDFRLADKQASAAVQGIWNDGGAGVTGDIDLKSFATGVVTGGAGLLTTAFTLFLFCIKGVQQGT